MSSKRTDYSEEELRKREESKQRRQEENQRKKENYQDPAQAKANEERAKELLARNSKQKQNSNFSYYVMFAVLGALTLYVIVMMFLNQQPPLNKVLVIEDRKIEEHNNSNVWKQQANEFFEGATLADAKKLMNVGFASHQNLGKCTVDESVVIPDSFHYRDAFTACVLPTQDSTKSCGASYAFTIAQTVAERNCISNGLDKATPLSAQELLKCDIMNNGCKNGHLNLALDHVRAKGLVDEECLPYKPEAEKCEGMCENPKRVRIDNHCLIIGEDDIKREIIKNGPVVSTMNVYVDFLTYKKGVYYKQEEVARFSGQHAVRIVGWGVESGNEDEQNKGNKYWIIQNTWGKTWGDEGFAKVAVGQDLFFDQYAYGLKIKSAPQINLDDVQVTASDKKGEESVNLDLEDAEIKTDA